MQDDRKTELFIVIFGLTFGGTSRLKEIEFEKEEQLKELETKYLLARQKLISTESLKELHDEKVVELADQEFASIVKKSRVRNQRLNA